VADDAPVALVTGGAGFIGSAVVDQLRASGHHVVALDLHGDPAVDLSDEHAVRAAARAVLAEHGRVDVLVHAGVSFQRATLADLDATVLRNVMAVNVEAPLWLVQELEPGMTERGFGRVVFLVSDTFFNPPPVSDMLPYITSKGALIGASRSLARSLGASGITVNCVAPGLTPPPVGGMEQHVKDDVLRRQALPRPLVPDDVANVVAFLVRPESQAITGQTLCPDGGLVLL
jgi:NAD(P)-dependent dehydrogenase (short-subunit alcohol dehydrogenase family)